LITLAGDFLAPSLLSSLDKGRSMVDVLNACGFTHVCFGNHECDVGKEALKQNFENSSFTWINTNMQELNDKLDMKTPSSVIVEVKHHGESIKRVGLLGLLTNDPALYRPDSFDGSTIEPVVECTERYLRQHSVEDSIDLWIPLTHQSMADDRIFANKFGGTTFPIILGGHDHWSTTKRTIKLESSKRDMIARMLPLSIYGGIKRLMFPRLTFK
jgi:2',3'-cyclic-nucleotide 2'-phosphodiesterase (5'-nucleotidase family)